MSSIGSIDGKRVKEREGERERTAVNRRNPPILSRSRFRISIRLSKGQSIANRRDRYWSISAISSSFTRSVGTARCILHCCEYLDENLHEKCVTNVRQGFETSRWSMQSISSTVRLFSWTNRIDSKTKKSWRFSYASTWSEGQRLFLLQTFFQVFLSPQMAIHLHNEQQRSRRIVNLHCPELLSYRTKKDQTNLLWTQQNPDWLEWSPRR